LAPYAAILYYEIGEAVFPSPTFYYYVQTFITKFMGSARSGITSATTCSGTTFAPQSTYFIRGCFVIGIFYLAQQRTEEAKMFFL
jgi:hypothetical protein